MAKYIDADIVIAKIERRMVELAKDKYIDLHDTLCKTKELKHLLDFINSLPDEPDVNRPEPYSPVYDEAYLKEKIDKATESWKGVDVDAMLAECRGYEEPATEEVDLPKWREYKEDFPTPEARNPLALVKCGEKDFDIVHQLEQGDEYILFADLLKLPKED